MTTDLRAPAKSTRLILWILVLAVIGGALVQGTKLLSRQRTALQQAQQRTAHLQQELATQTRTRDSSRRELTLAETQLAELTRLSPSPTKSDARTENPEFSAWIARVKKLKQLFAQRPEQRIPELQLLTDEDWLIATRQGSLDSEDDIRRALAAVRHTAKERFAVALDTAVRRFVEAKALTEKGPPQPTRGYSPPARSRTPPASVQELAAYLENPLAAEILPRLVILNEDSGWILRELNPIDPDYDSGYSVHSNAGPGQGVSRAPWAWFPPDLTSRMGRAHQAYRAAHNGLLPPGGTAEVLSYFDPPLEPVLAERVLRAIRAEAQGARR